MNLKVYLKKCKLILPLTLQISIGKLNICITFFRFSPSQVVLSGLASDINECYSILKKRGLVGRGVNLNVSHAFHSRLMLNAQLKFNTRLKETLFKDAVIPIISNTTGLPVSVI